MTQTSEFEVRGVFRLELAGDITNCETREKDQVPELIGTGCLTLSGWSGSREYYTYFRPTAAASWCSSKLLRSSYYTPLRNIARGDHANYIACSGVNPSSASTCS